MAEPSDSPIADSWDRYRKAVIKGEPSPEVEEWFRMCFYGGAAFMFTKMFTLLLNNAPLDLRVKPELALAWRLIQLELDGEMERHSANPKRGKR